MQGLVKLRLSQGFPARLLKKSTLILLWVTSALKRADFSEGHNTADPN
jgi:hypothetical protein